MLTQQGLVGGAQHAHSLQAADSIMPASGHTCNKIMYVPHAIMYVHVASPSWGTQEFKFPLVYVHPRRYLETYKSCSESASFKK